MMLDLNKDREENRVIVHEKQSRQLCAVHAINNLLQLKAKSASSPQCQKDYHGHSEYDFSLDFAPATKDELDQISDDLALKEKRLLQDTLAESESAGVSLSMWDTLFGNRHRTICMGNYSYEVLEKALERRNVHLSWLNSKEFQIEKKHESLLPWQQSNFIGFITNEEVFESNMVKRLVLPKDRRHWVAIRRFLPSYTNFKECDGFNATNSRENVNVSCECFFRILDSQKAAVEDLTTWTAVENFIEKQVQSGSQILIASTYSQGAVD